MTLDDFETAQDLRAAMAIIPLAALAIGLGIGAYRQSCTSQPTEDTVRKRMGPLFADPTVATESNISLSISEGAKGERSVA